MRTAKIHRQLIVDKYPNIVITADAKDLARLVYEPGMGFKAEMLVTATRSRRIFF